MKADRHDVEDGQRRWFDTQHHPSCSPAPVGLSSSSRSGASTVDSAFFGGRIFDVGWDYDPFECEDVNDLEDGEEELLCAACGVTVYPTPTTPSGTHASALFAKNAHRIVHVQAMRRRMMTTQAMNKAMRRRKMTTMETNKTTTTRLFQTLESGPAREKTRGSEASPRRNVEEEPTQAATQGPGAARAHV